MPNRKRSAIHIHRDFAEVADLRRLSVSVDDDGGLPSMDQARSVVRALTRRHPDLRSTASVADVYALSLIHGAMHIVIEQYRRQRTADLFDGALSAIRSRFTDETTDQLVDRFVSNYAAYGTDDDPTSVAAGSRDARSGGEDSSSAVALEELTLLWIGNANPAARRYRRLFRDDEIRGETCYDEAIGHVRTYLAALPSFGPDGENLIDILLAPAQEHPESLQDQLSYIQTRWSSFLGPYLSRLLRGLDYLRESNLRRGGPPGPPQSVAAVYSDEDVEQFSQDRDWMPKTVLLAKSTLVWLDQLSRAYGRTISRLDEIPDEEIDRLASRGFTGLWLIGIWERSEASRQIKRLTGNPEAEASAYALYDYQVADRLGGWDALDTLRSRCRSRGIRLAADMVPNHTGIDGRWVREVPDRFIQTRESPYPNYRFSGENLSGVDGLGVYIEDHYYDRTDAAVVFKRVDFRTGDERYIYHGNDGTHMPWNDTAQLNFLDPETRAAVIDMIIHVARNFPIIRFDAAMTLARRHFQRLWFPPPGHGGDIPSRSQFGLTPEQFHEAMPVEFWREVVDRVAAEAPDTLLLAEAFWMMEGYFVRTLGMHRVYNSAFMHMLKNEDNAKYRKTIKNTIEFDKDILKRFVNFMNNPDEDTAIAQFGDGDKYFGVCTLMATMPGLPMFGHGQIEGFHEKYGMEYARAYHDETPNSGLIARHEREVFPLLRRRELFAGVEEFFLYDLIREDGHVDEAVFAHSNGHHGEHAIVVYNNRYESTRGHINWSAEYVEKAGDGVKTRRREKLVDAIGITPAPGRYVGLYEQRRGVWYLRRSEELRDHGLHVVLSGYEANVFTAVATFDDSDGQLHALYDELAGAGTGDVARALLRRKHRSLVAAFIAAQEAFAESVPGVDRAGASTASADGRPKAVRSGAAAAKRVLDAYAAFAREAATRIDSAGFAPALTSLFAERANPGGVPTTSFVRGSRLVSPLAAVLDAATFIEKLREWELPLAEPTAGELGVAVVEDPAELAILAPALASAVCGQADEVRGDGALSTAGGAAADGARGAVGSTPGDGALGTSGAAAPAGSAPTDGAKSGTDGGPGDGAHRGSGEVPAGDAPGDGALATGCSALRAARAIFGCREAAGYLGLHEYEGLRWFRQERFDALVEALRVLGALTVEDADDLGHLAREAGYAVERVLAPGPLPENDAPDAAGAPGAPDAPGE